MRKTVLFMVIASAALSACGKGPSEGQGGKEPPPLYENPPFGASDIDATVAETRKRMTPDSQPSNAQAPAEGASGNSSTN